VTLQASGPVPGDLLARGHLQTVAVEEHALGPGELFLADLAELDQGQGSPAHPGWKPAAQHLLGLPLVAGQVGGLGQPPPTLRPTEEAEGLQGL